MSSITPQFDVRYVARAALVGAIVTAGGATVWQIPAARELVSRRDVRKALFAFVTTCLKADGRDAPGLAPS